MQYMLLIYAQEAGFQNLTDAQVSAGHGVLRSL